MKFVDFHSIENLSSRKAISGFVDESEKVGRRAFPE